MEPRDRAVVRAGDSLTASWTLPPDPRDDVDEMELLLSLDGGESYPIRLTRDLAPDVRSLRFQVPALPTRHARIALRAGADDGERVLFASDEFVVDASQTSRTASLIEVRGEFRTEDALEGPAAPVVPEGLLDPPSDRMSASWDDLDVDEAGHESLVPLDAERPAPLTCGTVLADGRAEPPRADPASARFPLRE